MSTDVEANASVKEEKEFAKPVALPKAPEKKSATSDNSQTCSWQPPEWAQECTSETAALYSLDVLKEGKIVDSIALKGTKPRMVLVGRQIDCDIRPEHPSLSRWHAAFVYGKLDENQGVIIEHVILKDDIRDCWYLIDLGSTHKTRVNKCILRAQQPWRLYVGHVIKFGLSTRMYIVQGPEDDVEEEAELRKPKAETSSTEVSWGMSVEKSEDDDIEPALIDAQELEQRESYYRSDPRKALKAYYDREGLPDPEFEYSEKGAGSRHQWMCKLSVPIGARLIDAEASVSGGKKEAQLQCMLEACRLLDRYHVLRPEESKGRTVSEAVRAARALQENDYYSSDEDTFFDRTGQVEAKRLKRKQRIERLLGIKRADEEDNTKKPMRYDEILKQIDEVDKERENLTKQLQKLEAVLATKTVAKPDDDELDAYMNKMREEGTKEKAQIVELRRRSTQLKHEGELLRRLAKVAKPAEMPTIDKLTGKVIKKQSDEVEIVGQTQASSVDTSAVSTEPVGGEMKPSLVKEVKEERTAQAKSTVEAPQQQNDEKRREEEPPSTKQKFYGVALPPGFDTGDMEPSELRKRGADSDEEGDSVERTSKSKKPRNRVRNRAREPATMSATVYAGDDRYATWLPPETQEGDGRTSLNAKLGY